jgi:hypothetical protein
MRDQIETAFLNWQERLPTTDQELVVYEDYDASLQTVFVERLEGLDVKVIRELEAYLQKDVDPDLLVSSVVTG